MSNITPSNQSSNASSLDHKKLEAGFLGKFFGYGDAVAKNIGALLIICLIIVIFMLFLLGTSDSIEYAKLLIPVLTLVIGYLFGQKIN